ncbi:hypothetical protein K435DRAFT_158015 [Dendrothele bispora CBS 962.96]|uniref:Uncharacterized protein n=1 Tax=Dendrothele bispora (strain CBS 962.96) TaxID=1314807 RepID=A0A4S8LZ06_DENBC|nr:hypothetical protein K435DRAFT_158015 [Dendrothele bispora CBS 962.96]
MWYGSGSRACYLRRKDSFFISISCYWSMLCLEIFLKCTHYVCRKLRVLFTRKRHVFLISISLCWSMLCVYPKSSCYVCRKEVKVYETSKLILAKSCLALSSRLLHLLWTFLAKSYSLDERWH